MIVFRSILVPIKAAIMNLLSIGAAYGVVVLVFQKGVGAGLSACTVRCPSSASSRCSCSRSCSGFPWTTRSSFSAASARSTTRRGDNTESVIVGITTTARVITCAALIMISVFLSFVFGGDPTIKMMGVGLATAVLVDATLIRLVLVPATMKLLGNANWWFPKWLDRLAAEHRHRR